MSTAASLDDLIDPLGSPLEFVLLAAHMAGIEMSGSDVARRDQIPESDFVLEFELAANLHLHIEHDALLSSLRVTARASALEDVHRVARVALQLNHHLPGSMKFSLDEAEPVCLHVRHTLMAVDLELDTLAMAITQVSEAIQIVLIPGTFENVSSAAFVENPRQPYAMIRG